jgi:hypothetical protein
MMRRQSAGEPPDHAGGALDGDPLVLRELVAMANCHSKQSTGERVERSQNCATRSDRRRRLQYRSAARRGQARQALNTAQHEQLIRLKSSQASALGAAEIAFRQRRARDGLANHEETAAPAVLISGVTPSAG